MKDEVLETERMILRRFTMDDVDALFALGTIPEIIKYVGNSPFPSREATAEFMKAHPLRDYEVYGYGRFACVWKETGEVIGFNGVKYLEEVSENEMGYRFLPNYWNKGLATESARVVIDHARDTLKLKRLVSLIHPENEASKNVVRKLGFVYEKNIPFSLIKEVELEVFATSL